eukprot:TRINITY_DN11520_c0_g1_i1.p1 TRINITY_DN11520_c0_g1~~TRINITY_DN11520_c0_g1_i1.p1  ORF type:complete len:186 (-),score=74.39 TRINITY_DN11520_c0_g1_i1:293-850(-)
MAMSDMMVTLPMLYAVNQIDFKNEQNVLLCRLGYATVTLVAFGIYAYLWTLISSKNDQTVVVVPETKNALGSVTEEAAELPTVDYDHAQLKKALQQLVIGAVLVSFLHYKFEIVQPLFIQLATTPMQLYKNAMFKIHLLGKDIPRPIKEESPFAKMMGQTEETPEQPAVTEKKEGKAGKKAKKEE